MKEDLLREIAMDYLVPFFSGSSLEDKSTRSSPQEATVSYVNPQSIAFKVNKKDAYRLVLTRRQPFTKTNGNAVPEISVVRAFVDTLASMEDQLATDLKRDLLFTFQRRIVVRALGSTQRGDALLSGLDLVAGWSDRLYEGSPISASIGFRNVTSSGPPVHLSEFGRYDFGAVVGNGYDTLLEFNFDGLFIRHASLPFGGNPLPFCPFRQGAVAEWTIKDEKRRRVAFVLNRLGEILAFRDGRLLFAFRSGHWRFLTHEPVLTQMGTPQDKAIRQAIYETCLDASFARTGACVGVVSSSHGSTWTKSVAKPDRLSAGKSIKAKALAKMANNTNFQNLDRRLRQELVAIDGATVLSNKGEILAVGAILAITGGSTGGGRTAAALELSKYGLGIKVSQDGGITGYRPRNSEPEFRVM